MRGSVCVCERKRVCVCEGGVCVCQLMAQDGNARVLPEPRVAASPVGLTLRDKIPIVI